MSRGMSLLVGISVGALSLLLVQRIRQIVAEQDPDALADRLNNRLDELESRLDTLPQ